MNAIRILRRFRSSREGVSAIEFALVLPVLIILYLGGVEVTHGITVDRKLTAAASATGDLVAQAQQVNNADMNNIFGAASAIIAPYDPSALRLVVSSVQVSAGGGEVLWSRGFQTAPRAAQSAITIPAGVAAPGTTVIVAEAEYLHTPIFGLVITDTITLRDTFYLRPRVSDAVQLVAG